VARYFCCCRSKLRPSERFLMAKMLAGGRKTFSRLVVEGGGKIGVGGGEITFEEFWKETYGDGDPRAWSNSVGPALKSAVRAGCAGCCTQAGQRLCGGADHCRRADRAGDCRVRARGLRCSRVPACAVPPAAPCCLVSSTSSTKRLPSSRGVKARLGAPTSFIRLRGCAAAPPASRLRRTARSPPLRCTLRCGAR